MKSLSKDKLLLIGFIVIIIVEFSVHYHDEKTIQSLRLKEDFKIVSGKKSAKNFKQALKS